MKIIFDLDHTLFSTKKFYQALQKNFEKIGIDGKLFSKTFEASKRKTGYYEPLAQFRLIVKIKPEISIKVFKKRFKTVTAQLDRFLYSDSLMFLEKMRKEIKNRNLYIVSYGSLFQKEKIKRLNLKKYFKKILITKDINKTSCVKKILKKSETAIFIDDDPRALYCLKKSFPKLITVRINRGEGRYKNEPDNPQIDFSISNLKKLKQILGF